MKFSIQHNRAIAGNDITVGVEADGNEVTSHATTNLDGFDIGDDEIDPPSVSYERQLLQAGDASPHLQPRTYRHRDRHPGKYENCRPPLARCKLGKWRTQGSAMMSKLKSLPRHAAGE